MGDLTFAGQPVTFGGGTAAVPAPAQGRPGNCLFGFPNRVLYAALAASGAEAALPVTNLANDQGAASQGWQAPGTAAWMRLTLAAADLFRVLSLHRTNLTAGATWRWRIWATADTTAAPTFDSGVVAAGIVPGFGQAVLVLPADVIGLVAQVDIGDPGNPDGFINVALAFIGPAWQPARNFSFQSAPGRTDKSARAETRSGGVVIRSDWVKRGWKVALAGVRAAEVGVLMDLDLYARRGNNLLFVPAPDSTARNRQALFGEVQPTSDVTYPYQAADARGYAATLTERL